MNLYLIKQDVNNGYDTYDSAVVIASSAEEAKTIHPEGYRWEGDKWSGDDWGVWCEPDNVTVVLVGQASSGNIGDVIIASFNAG
jgi:hypothetical protein